MTIVAVSLVLASVAGLVTAAVMPSALVVAVVFVAAAVPLPPIVCWTVEAVTDRRPPRGRVAVVVVAVLAGTTIIGPPDAVVVVLAVPLAGWGCALALIDIASHRLPDVLVLSAYPPVGAVLIVAAIASGEADALLRAGMAASAALTAYGLAAVAGQIGFGDAKLAGILGLMLGWVSWASVLAAGLLAVGFAVVPALRAWTRRGRRARFAFGPPLLLGALAGLAVT